MEILKYKTQQPHVATGKAGNNMLNRWEKFRFENDYYRRLS